MSVADCYLHTFINYNSVIDNAIVNCCTILRYFELTSMAKAKTVSAKVVKMRNRHANGARANGSIWSSQRLQEWAAAKEGEPAFVPKLKRMLLTMIREGKAVPDGTDGEGNPTFTFK